ncbi:hypothetical protein RUM44_005707 [Polyplax serrata]
MKDEKEKDRGFLQEFAAPSASKIERRRTTSVNEMVSGRLGVGHNNVIMHAKTVMLVHTGNLRLPLKD